MNAGVQNIQSPERRQRKALREYNVRTAVDTFTISREKRERWCRVQKLVVDSLYDFRERGSGQRCNPELFRLGLLYSFNAFGYLHPECEIVHAVQSAQVPPQPVLTEVDFLLDNLFLRPR